MHTHYKFFETVLGGKGIPFEVQLIADMAPDSICGCSTCKAALDNAARDANEMIKTMCPASLLMYGEFLKMIAKTAIASSMHLQNPNVPAVEILESAHFNFEGAMDKINAVGIKFTPELYDAGEDVATAYLKRVLPQLGL